MKGRYCFIQILFIYYISAFENSLAQSLDWIWENNIGGVYNEMSNSIAHDNTGNIYTTGYFMGSADFDPGPGTFNLFSSGATRDVFISKLDASGHYKWAISFGGMDTDAGYSIAIDPSPTQDIVVTGYFSDSVDFDPGTGISLLVTDSTHDMFVAKYDSSGNLIWARSIGATAAVTSYSTVVDLNGNVYTTGIFQGTGDFDPDTTVYNLTSNGGVEIFISKLNTSGSFVYAKSFGDTIDDHSDAITIDQYGNSYTTGYFQGNVDFDPDSLSVYYLSGTLSRPFFILKLDSFGVFVWAQCFAGPGYIQATSIAVDTSGKNDVFVTGFFGGSRDFDPGLDTTVLNAGSALDLFVCKLDSSGKFVWAKSMGGALDIKSYDLVIDPDGSGSVYATGNFLGTADFDPGPATYNLTSAGSWDVFVYKLDSAGNFIWAKSAGGIGQDYSNALTIDPYDNLTLTGYFLSQKFQIGSNTLLNYDTLSPFTSDIFIAELSGCASYATVNPVACKSYVSPSGNFTWTTSGVYTDTLSGLLGCDSIITINLTINTVDTAVSMNGPVLMANATGGVYQWLDCNNGFIAIPGQSNQIFNPQLNGIYAVIITLNGCPDTSGCFTITGVGISDIETVNNFEIFPNPVTDKIIIIHGNENRQVEIILSDLTGKKMYEKIATKKGKIEINTRGIENGTYLLLINGETFNKTKKVVILR